MIESQSSRHSLYCPFIQSDLYRLGSPESKNLENSAMKSTPISRRSLALGLAAFPVGLVIAAETPVAPKAKSAAAVDGLSHTSEAIRQEITLDSSPQRVYQVLITTK